MFEGPHEYSEGTCATAVRRVFEEVQLATRRLGRTIVVIPAYNSALSLRQTVERIPPAFVDEIILVDDGSEDETVQLARKLDLTVIEHSRTHGHGATLKTCFDVALERCADNVVVVNPDHCYQSGVIGAAVEFINAGVCDVLLGSRIRGRDAVRSGMPLHRYLVNRLLTLVQNLVYGQNIGEYFGGFRVFSRTFLESVEYHKNSDHRCFDNEIVAQAVYGGFRLADIPVNAGRYELTTRRNVIAQFRSAADTLNVLGNFLLARTRLVVPRMFR